MPPFFCSPNPRRARGDSVIAFIARRIAAAVPLGLGILTIVFLIVQLVPGDPFDRLEEPGADPRAASRLRQAFGADRPIASRYADWLAGFVTADLGVSFSIRRPVASLIGDAVRNTLALAGLAILLQTALGTAAGIAAAGSRGGWADRIVTGAAGSLSALPSYWLGLVLVWVLSVRLGWLPASQLHSVDAEALPPAARLLDAARHLILPCLSLALPAAGGIALYVRDQMRAVLGREYLRCARARGVGERGVLFRHGARNALLPVVTLLGLTLPGLAGGSVVIEVLFAWPGMGRLAYEAVLARDEPLILGCVWTASLLVIAGSLLADLLAAALDPRIRERLP